MCRRRRDVFCLGRTVLVWVICRNIPAKCQAWFQKIKDELMLEVDGFGPSGQHITWQLL